MHLNHTFTKTKSHSQGLKERLLEGKKGEDNEKR